MPGTAASTQTLSSASVRVSILLPTCHLLPPCSGLSPGPVQAQCLSLASSPSSLCGEVNYFTQSPCYTQPRRFDDFPPLESVELKFISEPRSILHRLGNASPRHPAPPQVDPDQGIGVQGRWPLGTWPLRALLAPPLSSPLAPCPGTTFLSLPSSFRGSGFLSQVSEAWPALGQPLQPQSWE